MTICGDCDVFLVDDDSVAIMLAKRRLRHSGLCFKHCESGSAALEYLSNYRARLLLVDLHMMPMNGLELLEQLSALTILDTTLTYLATSAVPGNAVLARLDQLGIELLMKTDMLAAGGIAQRLHRPP